MHGTDVDGALLDPMDVGWAAFTLTTRPKLDVEIHLRTFFIIIDAPRLDKIGIPRPFPTVIQHFSCAKVFLK